LPHFLIRFSTVPLQKPSSCSRPRLSSWKRCVWRSSKELCCWLRIPLLVGVRDIVLTVIIPEEYDDSNYHSL